MNSSFHFKIPTLMIVEFVRGSPLQVPIASGGVSGDFDESDWLKSLPAPLTLKGATAQEINSNIYT